jgi:hypothetical protein
MKEKTQLWISVRADHHTQYDSWGSRGIHRTLWKFIELNEAVAPDEPVHVNANCGSH